MNQAMNELPSLDVLAHQMAQGLRSSRDLVEECLAKITEPDGQGSRAFTYVNAQAARACADAVDLQRVNGSFSSRFAGIPISIKDLFDVAGQITSAGSRVLADTAPAQKDALAVSRLRQAGFILIGRTQMPEFALSSLGLNDYQGTPLSAWGRIPGGSSSGAAISVANGFAHAALGSDTGGSCRIPAAFCGIVGFKPTANCIPMDGMIPLSPSLDAIGPLARTVACCASLHGILSGGSDTVLRGRPLKGMRFGIPQTLALDLLDLPVSHAFARALEALSSAGAHIIEKPYSAFANVPSMNARGGFVAAESLAWHRPWIAQKRDLYDPRVLSRIERGNLMTAIDYIDLIQDRRQFKKSVEEESIGLDAILMPTCAIVPPRIDELGEDEAFARATILALRNASLVNLFDGCAISLPMQVHGELPSGLMIAAPSGCDHEILAIATAIEAVLKHQRKQLFVHP